MAVYAVGDVQGCLAALQALLRNIGFDPAQDQLWFTGDLVNRGPQSLETLRFVRALGPSAVTVLGNHDLHLLALAAGAAKLKSRDTLATTLAAPDRDELLAWLRSRPLLHHDARLNVALVHAGLLPSWTLEQALRLAAEAQETLRHGDSFFAHMYGDLPDRWSEALRGHDRIRVIINALTRLRYCDLDGAMDLHCNGAPGTQPVDLVPWYAVPGRKSAGARIVFGHWSTLGTYQGNNVVGIDSGCVWGGALTAVRLDGPDAGFVQVPCPELQRPGSE
jgi:bis(5'-nucleosyl)-tetraphosphatase (symmetrical)